MASSRRSRRLLPWQALSSSRSWSSVSDSVTLVVSFGGRSPSSGSASISSSSASQRVNARSDASRSRAVLGSDPEVSIPAMWACTSSRVSSAGRPVCSHQRSQAADVAGVAFHRELGLGFGLQVQLPRSEQFGEVRWGCGGRVRIPVILA